ncbi:BMP family ABC transporter substrate-binding protein [Marinobacter zhejiangensis]|uniref:Basic membrane lipoprotein Med, substrate-binding protein (PBP1-ABC) superfamily n=1 Tax=Marinobacter zhejiangensis TaxID=488535 RepID=A0A1I4L6L9_9GAMM|nr:BMP family ABC transporter substrate-binding protein [Marinobacter zhejiangensis]SFL86519.1 Basic membrane lipoprotein Med, substrate-binding protein (PBP1-ABC) superfamily [Marinobacter zhejiangensis]
MNGWGWWIEGWRQRNLALRRLVTVLLTVLLTTTLAPAAEVPASGLSLFRPAILFNSAPLDDSGFNAQLIEGIERFEHRYDVAVTRFVGADPEQRMQRLETIASQGYSPILVPSSSSTPAVLAVAPRYPATTFVTLDYILTLPNVHSVAFREAEVAFLAGMAAASRSSSGHVGFMGAQPQSVIREFRRGFEAGARFINPAIDVHEVYLSKHSRRPWDDPDQGARLAAELYADGVDVLFSVAGRSGLGAMAEAGRQRRLVIGVDANQNALFPGVVLTSAVKRLDEAVYVSLINERYRLWSASHKMLGLAQGGLSLAIDEYSRPLLGEALVRHLEMAERKIVLGVLDPETGYENTELWQALTDSAFRPEALTLVLPDEARFPLVVGSGDELVQPRPGLLVDALAIAEERMGIRIDYVRQPRRRGVISLRQGGVDALVSVTDPALFDEVGRLPGEPGRPDRERALMLWNWATYRLSPEQPDDLPTSSWLPSPVLAPTASSAAARLRAMGLEVYENPRLESRFEMLLRGRVQAVVDYDLLADLLLTADERYRGRVQRVPLDLGEGASYLVFSKRFYDRYPEFCELMWNQLSEIRESAELWDRVPSYLDER